eukprot:UN11583
MSAVDLQRLNKMPQRKKDIVHGYVRPLPRVSNVNYNPPKAVADLCLLFFTFEADEWDTQYIGTKMQLMDDSVIVTTVGFSSSYLVRIAEYGVHEWSFKITQCQPWAGYLRIGICKMRNKTDPPQNDTYFGHKSFSFDVCKCRTGTIIEMILDFEHLALFFKINGQDFGKSHDIERGKYRAAVCMFNRGDCVTLLPQ